jgi:hypothetical protein
MIISTDLGSDARANRCIFLFAGHFLLLKSSTEDSWTCRGHLDFSCKSSDEGMCSKSDYSCHGGSIPALMACQGLLTGHTIVSTTDVSFLYSASA